MRDEKLYTMQWTQPYTSWTKPEEPQEETKMDLTLAREVLAKVMAK